MTTKKKKPQPLATREQFEREVDLVAEAQVSLATVKAEYTAAKEAVERRYGPEIKVLEEAIKDHSALCAAYARERDQDANSPLFEKGRRSALTVFATYGFRSGQPRLEPRSKMSWEKILTQLLAAGKKLYVRYKPEVNREALLLAAKALEQKPADQQAFLVEHGLKLVQDTDFFIEPKADDEARATVKEAIA